MSISATHLDASPKAPAGYKADMLHGIWAQAPYLHNGSVPTLGQLVCPSTRPQQFLRGNLNYDEALVGFEWATRPTARYGPNETLLVKEYDTTGAGQVQRRPYLRLRAVPGYQRPRSDDRPQRNRSPTVAVARRSVVGLPENAVIQTCRIQNADTAGPDRPRLSLHLCNSEPVSIRAPLVRRQGRGQTRTRPSGGVNP